MHLFNLKSSTILASFHFLDTASEKARGALINNFVTAVSVICRNLIRIFFGGGRNILVSLILFKWCFSFDALYWVIANMPGCCRGVIFSSPYSKVHVGPLRGLRYWQLPKVSACLNWALHGRQQLTLFIRLFIHSYSFNRVACQNASMCSVHNIGLPYNEYTVLSPQVYVSLHMLQKSTSVEY